MQISGETGANREQNLNSVRGEHLCGDCDQTAPPSVRTNQVALNEEERWKQRQLLKLNHHLKPTEVIKHTKLTPQTL